MENKEKIEKVLSKLGFLLGIVLIGLILFIVIAIPLIIYFWSGPPA